MNELLSNLLGLETLRFGGENTEFAWERPWQAWMWAVAVLGAAALGWWAYYRLEGPLRARVALGGMRALAVLLVLVMLSGPMLSQSSRRTEADWIVVLVDRSASMGVRDGGAGGSRDEQVREALERSWPAWQQRAERSRVLWMGFADAAFDLGRDDQPPGEVVRIGEADGVRTDLSGAVQTALDRTAARSLAGIVVLSDGRQTTPGDAQLWERLRSAAAPVFAVPLGASGQTRDLALVARAPSRAFVDDAVPVSVRIDRVADDGTQSSVTVLLIDEQTGQTLDQQQVEVGEQGAEVLLSSTPGDAGEAVWRVEMVVDGGDLIEENNRQDVRIALVDEPLRVVYLDGTPRWEHRYLKNLLLREDSIVSSSLLLAANRRYTQEGNVALVGLPRTPEEWSDIDVVILGDVRPELLGDEVMLQLRDHITARGAGLIWLGGPSATPHRYRGTPLGPLVPFVQSEQGRLAVWNEPVTLARSPAADELGVLRLGDRADEPWPDRLIDPATGWSRLWGVQQISMEQLRPATVPLAFALSETAGLMHASGSAAGSAAYQWPVVMTMRYGAGRSVYIGTDETWRWRYGLGDTLFDRFWLPLIRLAGRESVGRMGSEVALTIDPREPIVGQAATVELRLLDQSLIDAAPEALTLEVVRLGDGSAGIAGSDEGAARQVVVRRRGPGDPTYLGSWIPQDPGEHLARAATALLAGVGLEQRVTALLVDDESRDPRPDHALLETLAERTGGRVVPPDTLDALPEVIPNRAMVLETPPTIETLWDKPLTLLILMLLLGGEWLGRRLLRLA